MMRSETYLKQALQRMTRPRGQKSVVDPRTGVVRWIVELPINPGEPGIFNYGVVMADTSRYFPMPVPGNNGGAGFSEGEGLNAALGEAIERYCCSICEKEHLILGSYSELRLRYPVLEPQRLALFHPSQYEELSFTPFTEETKVTWVWGYSLIQKAPVLVPACLVYIPYFPYYREEGEKNIGPAMSTGLACARSYEDALLKGLCEVVERDAFMIVWLNQLSCPHVMIESSPYLQEIFDAKLKRDHLNYTLINMTTDIPIPAFLCLLIDSAAQPPMICMGGAAHLSPERAALKALIEAVQTREWAKFLGKEKFSFAFAEDFHDIKSFEDHIALYAFGDMLHAVDFLTKTKETQTFEGIRDLSCGVAKVDLQTCLRSLAEKGYDVIALDLTTSDVRESGFRVVKIIIPGFQQLDADYNARFLGGERLYKVPQLLGFRSRPATLTELNPFPHPYP